MTKLQAFPKGSTAQNEFALTSTTKQPSFLRPNMNLPKDFHFSQDIGPEIPLQGEKMKTSNPQDTFRISQKVSGVSLTDFWDPASGKGGKWGTRSKLQQVAA